MDELPKKCARFKVRFVSANSDNWLQPEEWHLGDDGSLIFGLIDDGNNHDDDELTIADLKDILTGGRDEGDFGVEEDSCLYVTDSGDYYRLLDEYFHIHWKYRIVDIPMIDDDTGDDDDDDDYDEDAEDNDDDEDGYDEESDDDGYEDDDNDNEDDGGDKRDRGDDFAQQAASSLVLGLIMENGRRRHDGD